MPSVRDLWGRQLLMQFTKMQLRRAPDDHCVREQPTMSQQRQTRRYYSSMNWRYGDIPCYEIVIEPDPFQRSSIISHRDSDAFKDSVCAPEQKRPLITVLCRDDTFPDGFRVAQLFADELFLTEEEARLDCIRRVDQWIARLKGEAEIFEQRKQELAEPQTSSTAAQ